MRRERLCRCGCGRPTTDAHHVLLRSLGGDDVQANVVGLWHDCHMAIHDGNRETACRVAETLTDEERAYLDEKLGPGRAAGYLETYYGVVYTGPHT